MKPEKIKSFGMLFEMAGLAIFGFLGFQLFMYLIQDVFGDFIANPKNEAAEFYVGLLCMFPMFGVMVIGLLLSVLIWVYLLSKYSSLTKSEAVSGLQQASEISALKQSGASFGYYIWCCERFAWSKI